jgi:demethylmenaquinone methyltransferase/2-methoxy-6-polyprenyl-1,4-benzoquinol methylase
MPGFEAPPVRAAAASDAALRDYYARRAGVYERIYAKPERQADLRAIEARMPALFAGRDVLEIACGTGWWIPHGARDCRHWLATDINEETLAIARTKPLPAGRVDFARVDAWTLDGLDGAGGDRGGRLPGAARTFDAAFAGFWWSHLPRRRLRDWLVVLHARLQPGAVVAMLDNRWVPGSSTPISHRDADGDTWQQRTLDDGSTHPVLKNFPEAGEAIAALGDRARDARWTDFDHYWLLTYHLS